MIKANKKIAGILKKRLPEKMFNLIRRIGRIARENGFKTYLVGGFLRDVILGVKNLDLDIVIDGDASSFVHILKEKMRIKAREYPQFGTAVATFNDGLKIDFAASRREHYPYPGCLPSVASGSIREDLRRRDFTINTLALEISSAKFGRLLDLFGAQRDLARRRIRVLHEKSFLDDPTRILRAVRFEQRYNFTIETDTLKLLKEAKKAKALGRVSKYRLGNELILMFKENDPVKNILRLNRLYGMADFHPALVLDQRMIKNMQGLKLLLKNQALFGNAEGWLSFLMILTFDLTEGQLKTLARQFSLARKDIQKLLSFKKNASSVLKMLAGPAKISFSQIYQFLHRLSLEEIAAVLAAGRNKSAKQKIKLYLRKLSRAEPEIKGRDLKKMGLCPGPEYRSILDKVLLAKLDGGLKTKRDEIKLVKQVMNKYVVGSM